MFFDDDNELSYEELVLRDQEEREYEEKYEKEKQETIEFMKLKGAEFRKEIGSPEVSYYENKYGEPYFVFNKKTLDGKYVAVHLYSSYEWAREDVDESELVGFLISSEREDFRSLGSFLDDAEKLGLPVSRKKDFERISHFATFADKLPRYREYMATHAPERLASRLAKSSVFFPVRKASYYSVAAENEPDVLVKSRYEEKASYWQKIADGKPVTPEEEARCGPGHKWDAVDHLVYRRHCLAQAVSSNDAVDFQRRVGYWRTAALEEQKVNALVRALSERDDKLSVGIKASDEDIGY